MAKNADKKTALITGSNGFIGTFLRSRLPGLGITCIPLPRYNLYSTNALKTFLYKKDFDFIFHLAAYGNHFDQTDDNTTINVNILATHELLEATKDMKYAAFVNFSSSSVLLPFQTMYSATKLASEAIVQAFANKYKKPVFSVRPASVYGEGEVPNHFIPQVINHLSTGEQLDVVLPPKHDFIHIEDFAVGVLASVNYADKLNGASINISTGIQTTNEEVINILENISGKKLNKNVVGSLRPYDTTDWNVDNTFLKGIGWTPDVTLEQGLKREYEYFKDR